MGRRAGSFRRRGCRLIAIAACRRPRGCGSEARWPSPEQPPFAVQALAADSLASGTRKRRTHAWASDLRRVQVACPISHCDGSSGGSTAAAHDWRSRSCDAVRIGTVMQSYPLSCIPAMLHGPPLSPAAPTLRSVIPAAAAEHVDIACGVSTIAWLNGGIAAKSGYAVADRTTRVPRYSGCRYQATRSSSGSGAQSQARGARGGGMCTGWPGRVTPRLTADTWQAQGCVAEAMEAASPVGPQGVRRQRCLR